MTERVSPDEGTGREFSRFSFLLAAMLLELMLTPLIVTHPVGLVVGRTLAVIVLLAALFAAGANRTSLLLFLAAAVAEIVEHYRGASSISAGTVVPRIAFLSYVAVFLIYRVLHDRRVTADTIAAAACAYMLIGLVWANIYQLIETLQPGSFDIPIDWKVGPMHDQRLALLYFSFATITTVGYGDIKPLTPGAGGFCVTEAIVGQFYLAVLIGRLVGLEVARRTSTK